ncbi:hypothetical protein C7M84_016805, partial [Penaeus vannamei]
MKMEPASPARVNIAVGPERRNLQPPCSGSGNRQRPIKAISQLFEDYFPNPQLRDVYPTLQGTPRAGLWPQGLPSRHPLSSVDPGPAVRPPCCTTSASPASPWEEAPQWCPRQVLHPLDPRVAAPSAGPPGPRPAVLARPAAPSSGSSAGSSFCGPPGLDRQLLRSSGPRPAAPQSFCGPSGPRPAVLRVLSSFCGSSGSSTGSSSCGSSGSSTSRFFRSSNGSSCSTSSGASSCTYSYCSALDSPVPTRSLGGHSTVAGRSGGQLPPTSSTRQSVASFGVWVVSRLGGQLPPTSSTRQLVASFGVWVAGRLGGQLGPTSSTRQPVASFGVWVAGRSGGQFPPTSSTRQPVASLRSSAVGFFGVWVRDGCSFLERARFFRRPLPGRLLYFSPPCRQASRCDGSFGRRIESTGDGTVGS